MVHYKKIERKICKKQNKCLSLHSKPKRNMKRIGTKRIVVFFLAVMTCMTLLAQQAKHVYITLDVSGSMTGNKYALANYTTQMIVTLCDDDDDINMIVYGEEECLSKKNNPLQVIQKPMGSLVFGKPRARGSQFDDIIGFNQVYKPSKKKQNWLFIIGDGVWATESECFKKDRDKFRKTVEEGSLNVCYLQTEHKLDAHTDFTVFADSLGIVDIRKSDINPSTIMEGCDHFARKILGFSEIPLKVKKSGKQCISIKAELPLKEFFIVYQDEVKPDILPKITAVSYGGNSLQAKLKGTPTTEPLKSQRNEVDLSGHVFHVKGNGVIPANTEIEVCFDKDINPANVIVYPIVEDVEFGSMSLTRAGGNLKQLDNNTFSICRDESKALVRIELNEKSKEKLPESLLKQTKVVIKSNNKDYKAKYNNGGFECEINLPDEETQYYAECDCPGYFKRITPIKKIVKGDCPPQKPVDIPEYEMPVADLGTITFEALKQDKITVSIQDSITHQALNPNLFDISFDIENDFLYEKPKWHIENNSIILELRPKGEWCECLFPEGLNIKMISTPKDEAFQEYGKNYRKTIFPIRLTVIKERSWIFRCLWVLILLIVLLLFIIYLRALLKKNRFKKSARIKFTYMEMRGSLVKETDLQSGTRLRQKGFVPWFNRWLVPFRDEYHNINWQTPAAGQITFVAAKSKETVNLIRDCFNPNKMRMGDYDPNNTDQTNKKLLEMDDTIKIYEGRRYQGRLEYYSGGVNDEKYYRIAIRILIFISIITEFILITMMIKSFL